MAAEELNAPLRVGESVLGLRKVREGKGMECDVMSLTVMEWDGMDCNGM